MLMRKWDTFSRPDALAEVKVDRLVRDVQRFWAVQQIAHRRTVYLGGEEDFDWYGWRTVLRGAE